MLPEFVTFEDVRAELLAQLRERIAGGEWTERGLAARLGISQPHLSNCLCGRRSISFERLDEVLLFLRVDLADLMRSRRAA